MNLILRFFITVLVILLCPQQIFATHFQGAEISYTCLGGCTYRITITEYWDCSGIINNPVSPSGGLFFRPLSSCSAVTPAALGAWTLVSDTEVTPLDTAATPGGTYCSGNPNPAILGVRQLVFSRDYDFCSVTCPVQIAVESCCRNDLVVNLANPSLSGYEIHTNLWNTDSCNSAPQWLDPAYMIIPAGQPARVSMAAFDPDGDSLAYSLDTLFAGGGIPASYAPGYSFAQPLGSPALLSIDSQTGDLLLPFGPNAIGTYAIGVAVKEYRDGILIGHYSRDLTMLVLPGVGGTDDNPAIAPFGGSFPTPAAGSYVDSFTIKTVPGAPLEIAIQALDIQPGDSVSMSWSNNLPGATFTDQSTGLITDTVVGINPVTLLSWTPTTTGRFAFNIKLEDTTRYALSLADYSFVIAVESCDLTVDAGADTVLLCAGDSALLVASALGGLPTYTYTWSNGISAPSHIVNIPGTYFVEVSDSFGCSATDTVVVMYAPACVWPGDADNDGLANNNDLLAIGLAYGSTGPLRPNTSLNWQGQIGSPWADTLPGGINMVFSDTDGNGLVNDDDTLAINLNYGLSHNKGDISEGSVGDPALFFQPSSDSIPAGDTLVIQVMLGVDTLPASNIYGLAFTIGYDPTLVDSGSVHVQYGGWLGTSGNDLLGLQYDRPLDGQVEVALTRKDLVNRSGFGTIATCSIVMIDDIAGKSALAEELVLTISQVRVIGADGAEIPVSTRTASVIVYDPEGTTSVDSELNAGLRIFPNPAKETVFLESETAQNWEVSLLTLAGQTVRQVKASHVTSLQLPVGELPAGLYLLRVRNEEGAQVVRKLEIR